VGNRRNREFNQAFVTHRAARQKRRRATATCNALRWAYICPVHRFNTPLLRRVYLAAGVFLTIYYGVFLGLRSDWNRERLYRQMMVGDQRQKLTAASQLIFVRGQKQLVRALKSESTAIRELASDSLWMMWFRDGGEDAYRRIQVAQADVKERKFKEALAIFDRLIEDYPRFAEGWNRRAILYWQMGQSEEAVADCKKALSLNPDHFGAWQGLGLGELQLGDVTGACRALRVALRLNPHDRATQRLLRQSEDLRRFLAPPPPTRGDWI